MLGRAPQQKNASVKKGPAQPSFTMQRLRRQALWGSAAIAALLIAVLSGRSEVGAQRAAIVLSSLNLSLPAGEAATPAASPKASRPFEAESAMRQLAQTVRGLADDRDRLMTRLAAVENNIDDLTGSISRQIEAAKTASPATLPPWPNEEPPVPATPATIAALSTPVTPPTGSVLPPAPSAGAPAAAPSRPEAAAAGLPSAAAPVPPSTAYGADIGSAFSVKGLHARWAGLHSAHPELFEGLRPSVTLRESSKSKRTELRLVVGPFASADAAAQLCTALVAFQQPCQPTMFDGRLALQ
jgi:hypothetical protein